MNDPQKYFYFRVKDNFLEDPVMWDMKNIPDVGYEMIVHLLDLYLISVKNGGKIRISLEETLDGYLNSQYLYQEDKMYVVIENLAKRLRIPINKMQAFLKYYLNNDLLEINFDQNINKAEITAKYVEENIGKSSVESDKKRLQYRAKKAIEHKEPILLPEEENNNNRVSLKLTKAQLVELKQLAGGGEVKFRNILLKYKLYKQNIQLTHNIVIDSDYEELKEFIRREK